MATIRTFSAEAMAAIKETVRRVMREEYPTAGKFPPRMRKVCPVYLAKTGGAAIAARSGDTVSSGDVTLRYIDSDDNLQNQTDDAGNAITKTVYNLAESASVAANTEIMIVQEMLTGKFVVFWEDC